MISSPHRFSTLARWMIYDEDKFGFHEDGEEISEEELLKKDSQTTIGAMTVIGDLLPARCLSKPYEAADTKTQQWHLEN